MELATYTYRAPRLAAPRLAYTQALLKLILAKPYAEIIFNLRENA